MKKTLYIIRHGETDYNRRGIVQGSGIDADLNEVGRTQAQAFFERYEHVPFDKVYTSVLKRTHQTVDGFLKKQLPHESLSDLNEISWGMREGITPTGQDQNYYTWLTQEWQNGNTHQTADGGESPEDVKIRVQRAMDYIISQADEPLVLIAIHGRALRVLLTIIANLPLRNMDDFGHSNTCLYIVEYQNDLYNILTVNDTTHLKS